VIRAILIMTFVASSWAAFGGDSKTTTIRDNYGRRIGSIYCPSYSKTCTIRNDYGQRLGSLQCDRGTCTIRNPTGQSVGTTKELRGDDEH